MKNRLSVLGIVATASLLVTSCCNQNIKVMEINNSLSDAEKSAGILTPEVMWKMARIGSSTMSPDGESILYTITQYNMADNKGVTNLALSKLSDPVPEQITDNAGNESDPTWSDDGNFIYYMSDRSGSNQLWQLKVSDRKSIQISDVEGGLDGYGVSPHGDKVFYIKRVPVAKRNSADVYPDLDKSKAKIYDDLMARHWNYWDDGSYLHIFVADLSEGRVESGVDIMDGEPWDAPTAPYFDVSEIAWNNAGTELAYTCKKLVGTDYALSTNSDIYLYNLESKQTRNLTEGMPGYDKYPQFSPDDSFVAFTSMERAGNESDKDRLFVINVTTGEKSYLTDGFDYNASNLQWDGNNALYFISPMEATHQVCRVEFGAPVKVLTSGDHDITHISRSGSNMVAELESLSSAKELFTVDIASGALSQLTNINDEIYKNVKMGEVSKRWITTTDGQKMLTWVVLPPDFDSTKTYPALLFCQGGPQSVVSQFWSYRWNLQLMAAQGYVVVAPNRRGLPSFGQDWLDQISGDYSGQNINDYLSAIDNVSAESWVDENRLGCVGASYGGYSVYYLAGKHNKRFKAFIAHCGMFNFESMYGATEELWFPNNDLGGAYWSDNETAKRSYANSPHKFVNNWDTPILIMTGLNDFRIPYTESLQAFTAARLHGVPSRLVAFENEAHQVFKPQNSLTWNREFFGWLDMYVKK